MIILPPFELVRHQEAASQDTMASLDSLDSAKKANACYSITLSRADYWDIISDEDDTPLSDPEDCRPPELISPVCCVYIISAHRSYAQFLHHNFRNTLFPDDTMEAVYSSLTARATALKTLCDDKNQYRVVVALAGPPGSGKSTIAAEVIKRLNSTAKVPFAAAVPMDGFHLSRATLDSLPNSAEAYKRRGASWTFDAAGVLELVKALHSSRTVKSKVILAPSFDHAAKDPLKDGIVLSPDITFVILEGNYLLLDEQPWAQIAGLVDDTWFVDVLPELAKERIAKRHLKSGIESTWEAAVHRVEENDLLNGDYIRGKLVSPAVTVQSIEE